MVNLLRIQFERQRSGLFPSIREYARLFGMDGERMREAKPDVLLLAPGPINRGVEITPEVADGRLGDPRPGGRYASFRFWVGCGIEDTRSPVPKPRIQCRKTSDRFFSTITPSAGMTIALSPTSST